MRMNAPNSVKRAAADGTRVRGVHMTFAAPTAIEMLASLDLDFVYLDGEHGAFGPRDVEACCIAAERHGITAIARVPDCAPSTITNFLDRGVQGLVVPHVNSLADAEQVVEAAYYAPLGQRSFGGGRPHFGIGIKDKPAHLAETNRETSVCIMIESRGALDAAGDIARLEGIDYMSFGMNDLAQSLGHAGQPDHADVVAAAEDASRRIREAGSRVREDFMTFAWINQILVAGARQLLGK